MLTVINVHAKMMICQERNLFHLKIYLKSPFDCACRSQSRRKHMVAIIVILWTHLEMFLKQNVQSAT